MAHEIWRELKGPIRFLLIGTAVALSMAQALKWSFVAYGKYYYSSLTSHPRVYCYDLQRGVLNPVHIGLKEEDTVVLRHYPDTSNHHIPSTQSFSWSRSTIVIRYIGPDSVFAELVQFDTACYGWIKGYLHRDAIHIAPPSQDMQEDTQKRWAQYQRENSHLFRYKPSICSSSYGFWCDCY